jgi:hypothetical protein
MLLKKLKQYRTVISKNEKSYLISAWLRMLNKGGYVRGNLFNQIAR